MKSGFLCQHRHLLDLQEEIDRLDTQALLHRECTHIARMTQELTAEIGANFLLVRAGLENAELRDNSAAYLRSWKSKIENNPKVLIWASERAARAVNLVLGIVPEKPKEVVESGTSPETEASQPMPLPPVVAMEAVLETEVVPPTAAAVPSMG